MAMRALPEPASIADRSIHLPSIDGLRGIAVLMVLAVHTSQRTGNASSGAFQFSQSGAFLDAGARGVELFFMLSAFTLFRSSHAKYLREASPQQNFYIRRAFRILPLWWLTVALYTFLDARTFSDSIPSFSMYFGFIRYLPRAEVFPLGWTIFVEETFYLFLPLLFGYILSIGRAAAFFVAMLAVSIVWKKVAAFSSLPTANNFVDLFPLNHWYCFALGILIYHLHDNESFREWVLRNHKVGWLLDLCASMMLLFAVRESRKWAAYGLALLMIAALSEHTLIAKICRSKMLRYFGICCYSIYLLHFLLLDATERIRSHIFAAFGMDNWPVELRFAVWFPVLALLSLAVCTCIFRGIEKPCVAVGKRVVERLEMRRAAALQKNV